jgi:FkbM family methyltransferase
MPRYTHGTTTLLGEEIKYTDAPTFRKMYRQIFEHQIYKFITTTRSPLIIDGGANIGLGTIYFKLQHPDSRVIAFEADKDIFTILQHNLQNFKLSANIELVPKALWHEDTLLEFVQEGGASGRLKRERDKGKMLQIPTIRLRDYLHEPVDFLKLDIEGAETHVLRDCADLLPQVHRLFVEYHSFVDEPQKLAELLTILQTAGFRYYMEREDGGLAHPFCNMRQQENIDFTINVFAWQSNLIPIKEAKLLLK